MEATVQKLQQTNSVVQSANIDQAEILAHKVAGAVMGYRTKNPTATEDQINAFRLEIAQKIQASANGRSAVADKKERFVRRQALLNIVESSGIHFRYHREYILAPVAKPDVFAFVDEKGRHCEELQTLLIEQASHTGGTTVAFTVKDDVATVALSVCRADENFDSLEGREIAVKRLFAGQTITFPINENSIFHPDFADEENYYVQSRIQLGALAQVYGAKYLGFKK